MSATSSHSAVHEGSFWTPFGAGTVVIEGDNLVEVRLPAFGGTGAGQVRRPGLGGPSGCAELWADELEAYFTGARATWHPAEVDLDALGLTPFRREVYGVLLTVPPGHTITYGELARLAGRPGAARAVGTAMAENPVAVVVPCHRVVRGDGSLGRYGEDDRWKPFLLRLEADR